MLEVISTVITLPVKWALRGQTFRARCIITISKYSALVGDLQYNAENAAIYSDIFCVCVFVSAELGTGLQQCSLDAKSSALCWICFPISPFPTSCLVQTSNRSSSTKVLIHLYMRKQRKNVSSKSREAKRQKRKATAEHTHTNAEHPRRPNAANHPLTHLSYSHIPWTPQFSTDGKHMTDERGKMNQRWHYWGEKSIATFFLSSRDEQTALTVTCSTVAKLQTQRWRVKEDRNNI